MKIAILWTFPADFIQANAKAAMEQGHEVLLVLQARVPFSPIVPKSNEIETLELPSHSELFNRLDDFSPDIIVLPGWHVPTYTKIAFLFHRRAVRVMVTDTQWRATLKQLWGWIVFRIARWRFFDWALVPGERQFALVKKLGFPINKISMGSIPANMKVFRMEKNEYKNTRKFIFVGRLVNEKGLNLLLDAYIRYRDKVEDPWSIEIVGEGYIDQVAVEGISYLGPLTPLQVATRMRNSSAFVLPSVFEPWAVVIQEAALSGLPIIASDECGAVPHYVHNVLNGFRIETNSSDALLEAMVAMTSLTDERLKEMSDYSFNLAQNQSQENWVNACEMIQEIEAKKYVAI